MNFLFLFYFLFSEEVKPVLSSEFKEAVPTSVAAVVSEPMLLQEVAEKDKENIGIKLVEDVVNTCLEIKTNDAKHKAKTLEDEAYSKINVEYFNKMTQKFDFLKVSNDSLQYDLDPKTKKFKKHHWNGKTQSEKDKFVNEFTELLSTIVYPICGNFFGNKKVMHSVAVSSDNFIQIKSKVFLKKKYVLAEWFIGKTGTAWKVFDVSIENESWVSSFRSQFTEVIEKKSYNDLFDIMAKKKKEVLDKRNKKASEPKKEIKVRTTTVKSPSLKKTQEHIEK